MGGMERQWKSDSLRRVDCATAEKGTQEGVAAPNLAPLAELQPISPRIM